MQLIMILLLMMLGGKRSNRVDDPPDVKIPDDIMNLKAEISAIEHFMYDAELSGGFWYDTLEARREHTRLINALDKRMGL